MRGPEDRLLIRVSLATIADLDWERIEEDPIWEFISVNSNSKEEALHKYLAEYLRSVLMFTNMPSTNGPSSIYIEKIEVNNVYDEHQVEGDSDI